MVCFYDAWTDDVEHNYRNAQLLITDFFPLYSNSGLEVDYVVGCLTRENQDPTVLCGSQDGTGFLINGNHPNQMIGTWKGHQV